ncbi:MAG: septation regulator SpoVG [Defluviitaleaceae bacterium]|nr:septation regulator SpoVG [Defluviitaleaceae bacterium]
MEITDIRIRKINPPGEYSGRMRAIVSVTFDHELVIHDIKVIQNEHKCFIAMPSRQIEDGSYKDIAHPIQVTLRNKIQDAVLAKYSTALAEAAAVIADKETSVL